MDEEGNIMEEVERKDTKRKEGKDKVKKLLRKSCEGGKGKGLKKN